MGFLDRFRSGSREQPARVDAKDIVVGAKGTDDESSFQTFNTGNITYQGDITGFDYTAIMRDKQGKISDLYK